MINELLKLVLPKITVFFNNHDKWIFRKREISQILTEMHKDWNIPDTMAIQEFTSFLEDNSKFEKIELRFPKRKEVLYSWGEVDIYHIAMKLKPKAYLSHFAAMSLHNLTDQIPKTIYLNSEQQAKPAVAGDLEQSRIDNAFKAKPRVSNRVANFGDYRICLLNGKHTSNLGVVDGVLSTNFSVRITNIERTLIDIAVRPFYAGGVFEVLEAYRRAYDKFNVADLVEMLKRLSYVYPYRQAIGFYMEKAGYYSEQDLKLLTEPEFAYDFYLTHQIRNPEYSERWRLYFPKGL